MVLRSTAETRSSIPLVPTLIPSLVLALTACGPDDRASAGSRPDPDPETSPACTARTTTLTAPAGWTLDDVVGDSAVLAHTSEGDDMRVAILDPDGITDLGRVPGGARYTFRAAAVTRGDGARCAVYASSLDTVFYACEGEAPESAEFRALSPRNALIPYLRDDGTLSVFTQTYSSFTELRRSPTGQWAEIEQYESSISYPTDTVSTAYGPIVCFISSGGLPSFDEAKSTTPSSSCKLAFADDTFHILTDDGYAQLTVEDLVSYQTRFTPQPFAALAEIPAQSRLVIVDGAPHVVGVRDQTLTVTRLPDGAPVQLDAVEAGPSVLHWDDARQVVTIAVAASAGSITVQTACL